MVAESAEIQGEYEENGFGMALALQHPLGWSKLQHPHAASIFQSRPAGHPPGRDFSLRGFVCRRDRIIAKPPDGCRHQLLWRVRLSPFKISAFLELLFLILPPPRFPRTLAHR